jgi:microcystin degradation protein MlrC
MSFTLGFPAADFAGCGPVVWAYAAQRQIADDAVSVFFDRIVKFEARWAVDFLSPEEAVAQAMRLSEGKRQPVVIADAQDNPGAGGESDTTGMLRALLSEGARDAAFGVVYDPAAVRAAQEAGNGLAIDIELGGESELPHGARFRGVFEVVRLSDGNCVFDGPMLNGMEVKLGTTALLKIGGVLVIVSSARPPQMMDRNLYRVVDIEPETMRILVNKSTVHFRADFDAIACATLIAKAPGGMRADPRDLPWKRLRPGLRIAPLGPAFGAAGE